MTREDVIARLRPHEADLRAAGIAALYLFGSTARNEAGPESDVDLLFELGDVRQFSFNDFFAVQDRLTDLLKTPVDLVPRKTLRPRTRRNAERDLSRIF